MICFLYSNFSKPNLTTHKLQLFLKLILIKKTVPLFLNTFQFDQILLMMLRHLKCITSIVNNKHLYHLITSNLDYF